MYINLPNYHREFKIGLRMNRVRFETAKLMEIAELSILIPALGVMVLLECPLVTYRTNPCWHAKISRQRFPNVRQPSTQAPSRQSRTSQGNSSTASPLVACDNFAARNGASFSAILCRSRWISRPIASEYRRSIWIVLRGTLHTTWPDSVVAGTRRACPSQVTSSNDQ